MNQDLIICKRCSAEHGPTEAKHVVRFNCDHCGKFVDTDNFRLPTSWSFVQEANVARFSLCPECTVTLALFLQQK